MYRWLRPLLFKLDPERAHSIAFGAGRVTQRFLGPLLRWGYRFDDPILAQTLWGVAFPNPIGVAAGLDKNAQLLATWRNIGCGFAEVGSITARQSTGNAKPRAFRLPADRALINRMGLNNDGAATIVKRVAGSRVALAIFANIAKTHDPAIVGQQGVDDILMSVRAARDVSPCIVLNISCPNTAEGKTFDDPVLLDDLLTQVVPEVGNAQLLVKLSPDSDDALLAEQVAVVLQHDIKGIVATNTTNKRQSLQTSAERLETIGRGGLSGLPLQNDALRCVRAVYRHCEAKLPIIGVGGIDDPDSAYAMVRAGASLLELYTALVYRGPGVVKQIKKGLARRLRADGYQSISDAVGVDA